MLVAEEVEQAEAVVPPLSVDGVVGDEVAVCGFRGAERAVGLVCLEEEGVRG